MTSILIGVTILFAAAWFASLALRRASAAVRHAIWTCALIAALVLPLLRWRAPRHIVQQNLIHVESVSEAAGTAGSVHTPRSTDLLTFALFFWTLGATLAALRLGTGILEFRRIVRGADDAGKLASIPILSSREIASPMVAGVMRPVILLPENASAWSAGRWRAVLAHEIAHIRRYDPFILTTARVAAIVYWFHPLCWLAMNRLRAESERACDDAALRLGLKPSGYAGHLLDLARTLHPQLAIPMATTSHLESRVKSILNPSVNRSLAGRRTWLAAALLVTILILPLATLSMYAQPPAGGGQIIGTVTDVSGARVPNTELFAANTNGRNREIEISRMDGSFAFHNIPAGHYSLEARTAGFAVFHLNDLVVANGGIVRANVTLQLGKISENMEVDAQGSPRKISTGLETPTPIRVGGNVQAASLIQQIRPIYPPDLQAQGEEGTVLLEAIISKEGVPLSLEPVNTTVNQQFIAAATDAVQQWRYNPTLLNGQPIEVVTTIKVDFKLKQ
jgi:TonB family protein